MEDKKRSIMGKIQKRIYKTKLKIILIFSMTILISVILLIFSIILTHLTESKIRENVKDNMGIVVKNLDVNMNHFLKSMFEGFVATESNQSLLQLRSSDQDEKNIPFNAVQYISLYNTIKQFREINQTSVNNVYINFADGKIMEQAYINDLLQINYSYKKWKERFQENGYYWVDAESCRELIPDQAVGGLLFRLYDKSEFSDSGIILITIKKDFLEEILDISEITQEAQIALITSDSIMYFGDHSEVLHVEENREHILSTMTQNSEIVTEIDQGFLYIYKKMKLTDWIIVYSTEESSISNAHYIIREVSVLTLIGIFVTCILTICFSDIMSRSLRELTDIVETDDILEHEISVRSYAEITLLSNGLERMRRRINSLLQQVQREQSMKRKTEIALLQEQIKPHFLYNTLFSVIQLCEMNRIRQATEMLRHLSDFYRTGLSKGESIVTIADEMKHLESYLAIQHFRYEDLFDYTIDCDTAVAGCRIPKMSLQPLVENAIYYGIKKRREKGNICIICGTYDGERVFIEVHDDGPGFTGKRFQEIKDLNSDSFGLKNVDARIKYEFGMDCGIEIETKSEDTCVRIWLTMESGSGDGEYEKKI